MLLGDGELVASLAYELSHSIGDACVAEMIARTCALLNSKSRRHIPDHEVGRDPDTRSGLPGFHPIALCPPNGSCSPE
jgi:hypothetical protein